MIDVSHISKDYGRIRAVSDVSFRIERGEIVGLLGPNGAGKTTTIRIITGYMPPSAGRVTIEDFDSVHQTAQARRLLGYLPESAPLYPEMRTRDYLEYRARIFGVPRAKRADAVGEAMERCRLGEVARRRVGQLSKGYRQRVGLAAALVHDPPVLILDEPTNGLDPSQIRDARSLIRELAQDRTVLLCSHILPEVERTCDRVVIIASGQIRADGTPRDLIERHGARRPYTVEVEIDPQQAVEAERSKLIAMLGAIEGIETVDPEPGVTTDGTLRFDLSPTRGFDDLRGGIGRALLENQIVVRELHRQVPSLEEIFMTIIDDEARPPASPREPAGQSS